MSGEESAFPELSHNPHFASTDGQCLSMEFGGGLTKRELFAAMAMQGLISNPTAWSNGTSMEPDEASLKACAEHAVAYADALLAELAKGKSE